MCAGCDFADLLNDLVEAGAIERGQRRAFAQMYLDSPSDTAHTLAGRAGRIGREDLASRAMRADASLERASEEFAMSFPSLREPA